MGNRALIKFDGQDAGVYLHWNGGRDSVEAFLEYCKLRNFRCDDYGIARFCQVVGNFFGGTLSIGVTANIKNEDANWIDNGIYIVKDWEIVGRIPEGITEQNEYDMKDMLIDIDVHQPENDRLGTEFILAPWVETKELHVGDKIFFRGFEDERPSVEKIAGIGKYGSDPTPRPYLNRWGNKPESNINNYLWDNKYKIYQ